jgi:hypothetical protein
VIVDLTVTNIRRLVTQLVQPLVKSMLEMTIAVPVSPRPGVTMRMSPPQRMALLNLMMSLILIQPLR